MNALIEKEVAPWFSQHSAGIANTVVLAMTLVEQMSDAVPMTGAEKLRTAIDAARSIVMEAHRQGVINDENTGDIIHLLNQGDSYVVPIIEAAIEVSKHPALVQIHEAVQTKCCGKPKRAARAPK